VALQGDLSSFAISDVLHLLANATKSGCLEVSSPPVSGEVWLHSGQITGGMVSSSPHASRPADLLLELLRLEEGSFLFDDATEVAAGSDGEPVADVLGAAEALLAEWREVEAVVRTLRAWIELAPNLDRDEVTLHADQWQAVAAVAGGATVEELADRCELTDLAASQMVRDLADARLVSVGEPREETPSAAEEDDFAGYTDDGAAEAAPVEDPDLSGDVDPLAELGSDHGPVVLAEGDGRLLPEPLPDEAAAYAAPEIAMGAVDGRSFESIEAEAATLPVEPVGIDAPAATAATVADAHASAEAQHGGASSTYHRREDLLGAGADVVTDEDRGSLLRFLSTVEP